MMKMHLCCVETATEEVRLSNIGIIDTCIW